MKKTVTVKLDREVAKDVYDALHQSQIGHSVDFATQRIKNIREVMDLLSQQLCE